MSAENGSEVEEWVRIEAESSFESGEEALESLVKLKDMDFEELFTNRNTQLDSEENEGISISFYHDERSSFLQLTTDEENTLNILLTLAKPDIEEAPNVMNNLLTNIRPILLQELVITKPFDRPFHTLDLPIEDDTEYDIVGIRIRQERGDYIIQEEETDRVLVTFIKDIEQELTENVEENFVIEDLRLTSELIEEGL